MAGLELTRKRKDIIYHPNKYLLSTYCKLGNVLHAGDITDNETGRTCAWEVYTFVKR